jgi:hypothetical protein
MCNLQAQYAVLHRVLHHKADDSDGLELAQPVDPVHRLDTHACHAVAKLRISCSSECRTDHVAVNVMQR